MYINEVNAQRLKEKEEMESNFANETDSLTAQHRRALQHLRVREYYYQDDLGLNDAERVSCFTCVLDISYFPPSCCAHSTLFSVSPADCQAQLDVKHADEISRHKRTHENVMTHLFS